MIFAVRSITSFAPPCVPITRTLQWHRSLAARDPRPRIHTHRHGLVSRLPHLSNSISKFDPCAFRSFPRRFDMTSAASAFRVCCGSSGFWHGRSEATPPQAAQGFALCVPDGPPGQSPLPRGASVSSLAVIRKRRRSPCAPGESALVRPGHGAHGHRRRVNRAVSPPCRTPRASPGNTHRAQPRLAAHLVFTSVAFCLFGMSSKCHRTVRSPSDQLLALSAGGVRRIRVITCALPNRIPLCGHTAVCLSGFSPTGGHLGAFQVLTITNEAAVNVQSRFNTDMSFPGGG